MSSKIELNQKKKQIIKLSLFGTVLAIFIGIFTYAIFSSVLIALVFIFLPLFSYFKNKKQFYDYKLSTFIEIRLNQKDDSDDIIKIKFLNNNYAKYVKKINKKKLDNKSSKKINKKSIEKTEQITKKIKQEEKSQEPLIKSEDKPEIEIDYDEKEEKEFELDGDFSVFEDKVNPQKIEIINLRALLVEATKK